MVKLVEVAGKRVLLTPFLRSEVEMVLVWRNSDSYRNFCSNRKGVVSEDSFVKELEHDFRTDRHEQYIIRKIDKEPVGTIFSYNFNQANGYVFVTTFLSEDYCHSIYGAEAHGLMVRQLFERYNLSKIYVEVYLSNIVSLKTMLQAGYILESIDIRQKDFKEQFVAKLSMSTEQIYSLIDFLDKITHSNFTITPFKKP